MLRRDSSTLEKEKKQAHLSAREAELLLSHMEVRVLFVPCGGSLFILQQQSHN